MFNPQPRLQVVPLFDDHECLVIDDFLESPQTWREAAITHREQFAPSTFAYPGVELYLPDGLQGALSDFFGSHIRARLGGRRTVHVTARLSLATLQPQALEARQWLCHRDSAGLPDRHCIIASVLYLFEDEALGGTSFYRPRRGDDETAALVHECSTLDNASFAARYPEVTPGYLLDSNAWFERMATVPARWNRVVFYDGNLFHSADLQQPERLSADPAQGRLTLNGFFSCLRQAAG